MKQKFILSFYALVMTIIFSCASGDDYQPLPIQTNPDIVFVTANASAQIAIFANDLNIPENALFEITDPDHGMVEVSDINNTPEDLSDDIVIYTPNTNYIGEDNFQYTICPMNDPSLCMTENVSISITSASTVVFNLNQVPYSTLSEYHFFDGNLKDLNPVEGVLAYDLNSPLFSDYAHKKRFVWMPYNVKANYVNDYSSLDFPTGAVLIKNFYYDNVLPNNTTRILETRIMYKKEDGWEFAKYVWNDEQTEATYTTEASFVDLSWTQGNQVKSTNYKIPSRAECFTCHNKFGTPVPIGPKPQNLNKNFSYADGSVNQLNKWITVGYLENNLPSQIVTTVDWNDVNQTLDTRVRSYLDINCAHCHSERSYCEYRPMRFAFNENDDDTNIGICVTPDTQVPPYTKIIVPNNIGLSLLHFRISTSQEQYRMPLLGRTIKHDEGVRLIEEWINSLTDRCD